MRGILFTAPVSFFHHVRLCHPLRSFCCGSHRLCRPSPAAHLRHIGSHYGPARRADKIGQPHDSACLRAPRCWHPKLHLWCRWHLRVSATVVPSPHRRPTLYCRSAGAVASLFDISCLDPSSGVEVTAFSAWSNADASVPSASIGAQVNAPEQLGVCPPALWWTMHAGLTPSSGPLLHHLSLGDRHFAQVATRFLIRPRRQA